VDLNTTAFAIVQKLSGQKQTSPRSSVASRAGLVGGPARAKVLSPERRKEIAANANRARWKDRK